MEWIKWNDRVPKEELTSSGYVLATTIHYKGGGRTDLAVTPMLWSDEYGWNSKDDEGEMAIANDGSYVAAWMYYPKPYQVEE